MNRTELVKLLESYARSEVAVDEVLKYLEMLPYQDLSYAKLDHHRSLRTGFPEVIFCQGKTVEQVRHIFKRLTDVHGTVLATRATVEMFSAVQEEMANAVYHELARCITYGWPVKPYLKGLVLVVSAGTADLPVAEEAAICAEIMGNSVERLYDVGVAGLHRLLDNQDAMSRASVIIVVAGMEGALASVVGGLTDKPVVAVPTSIGYGASFGGLAALLAMLNSCAAGVSVVNIDNGYGAAAMASAINRVRGDFCESIVP